MPLIACAAACAAGSALGFAGGRTSDASRWKAAQEPVAAGEVTISLLEDALEKARVGHLRREELDAAIAAAHSVSGSHARELVGLEAELEGAVRLLGAVDAEDEDASPGLSPTTRLIEAVLDVDHALGELADEKLAAPLRPLMKAVWQAIPLVEQHMAELEDCVSSMHHHGQALEPSELEPCEELCEEPDDTDFTLTEAPSPTLQPTVEARPPSEAEADASFSRATTPGSPRERALSLRDRAGSQSLLRIPRPRPVVSEDLASPRSQRIGGASPLHSAVSPVHRQQLPPAVQRATTSAEVSAFVKQHSERRPWTKLLSTKVGDDRLPLLERELSRVTAALNIECKRNETLSKTVAQHTRAADVAAEEIRGLHGEQAAMQAGACELAVGDQRARRSLARHSTLLVERRAEGDSPGLQCESPKVRASIRQLKQVDPENRGASPSKEATPCADVGSGAAAPEPERQPRPEPPQHPRPPQPLRRAGSWAAADYVRGGRRGVEKQPRTEPDTPRSVESTPRHEVGKVSSTAVVCGDRVSRSEPDCPDTPGAEPEADVACKSARADAAQEDEAQANAVDRGACCRVCDGSGLLLDDPCPLCGDDDHEH